MRKIGSAPKPSRRDKEALSGATILPFRLRASRSDELTSGNSAPVIQIAEQAHNFSAAKRGRGAELPQRAERLTIIPPRYHGWLKQAIIGAVLLHVAALALFHFQFIRDVERAANSGGTILSDGTMVLDIDIVAEAKLPPSKTPTNMTAPEAKTQTNTTPQIKQQEKQKEAQKADTAPNNAPQLALPKEELAAPKKTETSTVAQSPNQEKQDEQQQKQSIEKQKALEQTKKQKEAAPSTAAAPNRAAANQNNQSQTGANGFLQNGGQADASSYSALVVAHLQRYRIYPDQARSSGIAGVSTVRFTVGSGGNVIGVSLAGSSGHGVLDQAAVAMVHRASPFPPIPPSLGRGSMTFAAPVRFNLR